jgi:hypothetical protein
MLRELIAERREAWQDGVFCGHGLGWEQRGEAERERSMTGAQWRMCCQILAVLERDIGRADADLAVALAAPVAGMRQAVVILYRQHQADCCWSYVVLSQRAMAREVSAA